jgi:hypothetical protein
MKYFNCVAEYTDETGQRGTALINNSVAKEKDTLKKLIRSNLKDGHE